MTTAVVGKLVGGRVERVEDGRILIGRGRYVDDVALPGMLHAAFVRSPLAHARITSIDTTEARALPGVVAVRDSKCPEGGAHVVARAAFAAFLGDARTGRYDIGVAADVG